MCTYIWDESKRLSNLEKHGLDFQDAKQIFDGPVLASQDLRFDYGEDRFIGFGYLNSRVIVIAFTKPEDGVVRVISMRKGTKHESKNFEEAITNRLGPFGQDE